MIGLGNVQILMDRPKGIHADPPQRHRTMGERLSQPRENIARQRATVTLRHQKTFAKGPMEVIQALRHNQVPGNLVVGSDPGKAAARCTNCGSLFVTAYESCSYCGGPCERVNLWQEILWLALRHNVVTYFVAADAVLTQYGTVAAALSRSEPWELLPVGGRQVTT